MIEKKNLQKDEIGCYLYGRLIMYLSIFHWRKKKKQKKTQELMLLRETLAASSISFVHWLTWQYCWSSLQAENRSPTWGSHFFSYAFRPPPIFTTVNVVCTKIHKIYPKYQNLIWMLNKSSSLHKVFQQNKRNTNKKTQTNNRVNTLLEHVFFCVCFIFLKNE